MKIKKTNEGRQGGLVDGDFHSAPSGGVKTVITDAGNKPLLVEKNEVVIKKEAVQDPKVRTITGTNKEILHKINTEAGGTPILAEGGEIDDKDEVYSKWKRLVNMSASELQAFLKTPEGKKAGLTYEEAKKEGINNGKQSAKWIIRMKNTPKDKWSKAMWKWANKQISFISRMSGVDGALYDDKGNKTRKHTALLIWGHNPKKMAEGGEVKSDCIEYIYSNENIFNNGYFCLVKNIGVFADSYGGKMPNIDELYVISYNSGGQKDLSIINTINFSQAVKSLSKSINETEGICRNIINKHLLNGERIDNESISKMIDKNIVIIDRDTVVCHNINSKMAEGGEIENKEKLLAPNGKPSNLNAEQYRLVRTTAFKKWFGDWENDPKNASKVVDENGEPLVVYHGTTEKFYIFDKNFVGKNDYGYFGKGFYFGDLNAAESYAQVSAWNQIHNTVNPNGRVLKCFLNLRNPLIRKSEDIMQSDNSSHEFTSKVTLNYDGIISIPYKRFSPNTEYVVFESSQIKLADGTNTTFDPNNNDIRYENGGEVKETELSGESQYVINYLRSRKVARLTLRKSNPKYQKQIDGLEDAIKHGYVVLRENPINEEVYIMPTVKLRDTYKFELGGEI